MKAMSQLPSMCLAAAMFLAACGGAASVSSTSGSAGAAASISPASSVATSAKPAAAGSASAAPASAAAGSSASGSAAAKPTGTPIKIGVLDDLTGVGAIEASLTRINTDMVVDQTNASGGINGHPLEAHYVDPKGDAAQALQLATQLAQQDNVDALFGGIFSPECTGVQNLAPKFGLVYLPAAGCATDTFSTQSCNKYSFRLSPVGRQLTLAATASEVKLLGGNWGIIYPDYALGQSTMNSTDDALKQAGGTLAVKIPVPLGETNVTPYVTKIPTDGSIKALVVSMTGTDLPRVIQVMQQFGITSKMTLITALGKEQYAGVYPDAVNGTIIGGIHSSTPAADNQFDQAYDNAFLATAKGKDASFLGPLGGPDHVTPGTSNGYQAYAELTALKLAMRSSGFTGKADTDKLIAALENFNVKQGADFPAGDAIMNKADHQGRMTGYIMKINGQKEDILQTIPADQLPAIGSCQVK